MNKEKLIEKMREVSDAYVRDLIDEVPDAAHYLLMNDIAENMSISCAEAALKELDNEWVRVDSGVFPENKQLVLFITDSGWQDVAEFHNKVLDSVNCFVANAMVYSNVTHWRNLPSPPKDK